MKLARSVSAIAAVSCLMMAESSKASNGCEAIFAGAVNRPHGNQANTCILEWIPGSAEQENDFAALCRKLTGSLYISFIREEGSGRVACVFEASALENDKVAELPEIVRSWSNTCLEMEAKKDAATSRCWLRAVEAINPYASEAGFTDQVKKLQSAWLHRARDILLKKTLRLVNRPELIANSIPAWMECTVGPLPFKLQETS